MNGEVIVLAAVVVTQAGLLWYKLGKLEQKVEDICRWITQSPADNEEGK